jgi:1-acyl-sn-glycerol-3-phosphate acyltransferase
MDFYSASTNCPEKSQDLSVNPQPINSNSQVSPWLITLAYFLGRYFILPVFFGQIKIFGTENIPKIGPVILAPTHRARWDSLILPYAVGRHVTGRDLRFMVTNSECKGLQGWFIRRLGGFPVNLQRPAIATLRHVIELMQKQEMLVIFPEGGIHRDGIVHPLKSGIARLALMAESSYLELGIKIIPISIQYSQPYPSWGTSVRINIGEPIQVTDYRHGSLKENAKILTADLTHQLQELIPDSSCVTGQLSIANNQ